MASQPAANWLRGQTHNWDAFPSQRGDKTPERAKIKEDKAQATSQERHCWLGEEDRVAGAPSSGKTPVSPASFTHRPGRASLCARMYVPEWPGSSCRGLGCSASERPVDVTLAVIRSSPK